MERTEIKPQNTEEFGDQTSPEPAELWAYIVPPDPLTRFDEGMGLRE